MRPVMPRRSAGNGEGCSVVPGPGGADIVMGSSAHALSLPTIAPPALADLCGWGNALEKVNLSSRGCRYGEVGEQETWLSSASSAA